MQLADLLPGVVQHVQEALGVWSQLIQLPDELVSVVFVVDELILDGFLVHLLMFSFEHHNSQ